MLQKVVAHAQKRVMIMAAGVTPATVKEIIIKAGVDEVHSAAATSRKSNMSYVKSDAQMGHGEDFRMNVVDGEIVRAIKLNMAGI
jgi:copper homeostasis protein CutC